MDELIDYLSRYLTLSEDLINQFRKSHLVKKYTKGSLILRQGEVPKETFFILNGCVRSFSFHNGEEKTIDFYIEEDPILPLNYTEGTESIHCLECIEDTVAVVSNDKIEQKMLKNFPQLKEVCKTLSEIMYSKMQEKFAEYKISSPEERFKLLQKNRPTLFQRVPQYQIASYLGIRPESLSRIKKRLLRS